MKGNYQFSFNPNINQPDTHEEVNFAAFFKDLFPYFIVKSVTFSLIAVQALWFLLSCSNLTVLPSQQHERNVFLELLVNLVYFILLGRLGSEYQAKLGSKFYLPLIIIIQILRFALVLLLQFWQGSFIIVANSSLLALSILSAINLQKWKQNDLQQYQPQEKPAVQNYDLLDLNNTIIKLKPSESSFMYESYTNRQFYHHNLSCKEERQPKSNNKSAKKYKKSSQFIEQMSSEGQSGQLLYFKLVLCHYIAFILYPYKQFLIFIATQAVVYLLFATRAFKKWLIF